MTEKEVKFCGKVVRNTYTAGDFQIFALKVDKKKYPEIKQNKYNNVTIMGELPDLTLDVMYDVIATEEKNSKKGPAYRVVNIKRDIPDTKQNVYDFLTEFLNYNQANVLFDNYPDIIQRVMENRLDDIDLNRLKGIKEKTFEKIKSKIINNFCLSELVAEFKGYLSISVMKKLYNRYSSVDMIKKELIENPYKCLCGLAGIGFKTADSILLGMEKASKKNTKEGKPAIIEFESDLSSSPQRCLACILYLLAENEDNGNTKMNLADLRSECLKMTPNCIDHFTTVIKDKYIYYDKANMDVALLKTYNIESYIAQNISQSLNNNIVWDYDISKYRNVDGVDLSDEQMNTLSNVCKYNVSILNGSAGTGKSFSTQALINMLKEECKSFILLTPTGKSAKVLADFTKEKASTIHRGLGYSPKGFKEQYYEGNELKERLVHWRYNENNKLHSDIIIIDEFSMVGVNLFEKVIKAIDLSKTKLLLIGDNAQLPSVSCGNLLHDFMTVNIIPTTTLTKVFRYGEGGLMKVATDVRCCKCYLGSNMKDKVSIFGDNKDYAFIDLDSKNIVDNIMGLYKKMIDKGYSTSDIQVLTSQNKGDYGCIELNKSIQKIANKNYGSELKIKYGNTEYYVGDIVIQKVNNYSAKIYDIQSESDNNISDDVYNNTFNSIAGTDFYNNEFYDINSMFPPYGTEYDIEPDTAFVANGETGIIKSIDKGNVCIDFGGIVVEYTKNDLSMIDLGYSITIHKSQGSSIKVVILVTPKSHIYMMNSNLLYVGLTRMKKVCYHLGNLKSVNQAITKKANLSRNTFMQSLLINEIRIDKELEKEVS